MRAYHRWGPCCCLRGYFVGLSAAVRRVAAHHPALEQEFWPGAVSTRLGRGLHDARRGWGGEEEGSSPECGDRHEPKRKGPWLGCFMAAQRSRRMPGHAGSGLAPPDYNPTEPAWPTGPPWSTFRARSNGPSGLYLTPDRMVRLVYTPGPTQSRAPYCPPGRLNTARRPGPSRACRGSCGRGCCP